MQVYIIRATNNADFNESDIVVVGKTSQAAEKEVERILKARWKSADTDDLEFYGTEDRYIEAWRFEHDSCELAE